MVRNEVLDRNFSKILSHIVIVCIFIGLTTNTVNGWRLRSKEEKEDTHINSANQTGQSNTKNSSKLLVIMLDGFRWDYTDIHKDNMVALNNFLQNGVRAEWVEPIFPSVSYPAWTTLSTGVYPEDHNIIGNTVFDKEGNVMFSLDNMASTKRLEWWQYAEPIWTTASRQHKRVFLRYWSRCDVPYQGILPNGEYSGYESAPGIAAFKNTMDITLKQLRDNDLLMVYNEEIDNIGHTYGPDSSEMAVSLKELDAVFDWFFTQLKQNYADVAKDLNIVIVSDHGMANSGTDDNVTHVQLKDYISSDPRVMILGDGGTTGITLLPKLQDDVRELVVGEIYLRLRNIPGVEVYKRQDIPEKYHYKNSKFVHDILLVAQPGYHIDGIPYNWTFPGEIHSSLANQIPDSTSTASRKGGSHGYANRTEMNAIFFANGPAFKENLVVPPIGMEDIYQIYTHVLRINAQPHKGTWSRVSKIFKSGTTIPNISFKLLFFTSLLSILIILQY